MSRKEFKKKKTYLALAKQERYFFESLLSSGYSKEFINLLFTLADTHHPLDLITYIYKYSLSKDASDFLIKIYNSNLVIPVGDKHISLPKIELSYLVEWILKIQGSSKFVSKELNEIEGKKLIDNLINFAENLNQTSLIGSGILGDLSESIRLNDIDKKFLAISRLYQGLYHQTSEKNEHSYKRLDYIIESKMGMKIFSDFENIRKIYGLYLVVIYGAIQDGGGIIININKLLLLLNTTIGIKVNENDLLHFIEYYGVDTYSNYENSVIERTVQSYFPKKNIQNICNQPISIRNKIFNITEQIGTKDSYFLIETANSATHLLSRIIHKDALVKGLEKSKFYEMYCTLLVNDWIKQDKSKFEYAEKYQYGNSIVIRVNNNDLGEIDFYIFNKISGELIIFEIKDRLSLGKNLYKVDNIKHLTSKIIPGRKESGDIYEGMNQLERFYLLDKKILKDRLNLSTDIKNIHCIFLNTTEIFCWNAVMKPMLDGEVGLNINCYNFMSLAEFEIILSIGFKENIDLIEIIKGKNTPYVGDNIYLEIIKGRFYQFDELPRYEFKFFDSLYQDYDTYLMKKYSTDKGGGFFPYKHQDLDKNLLELFGAK